MENVVVAIFEMVGNHTKSNGFNNFLKLKAWNFQVKLRNTDPTKTSSGISFLYPQKLLDETEESYAKTPTARVDRIFQLFDTVRL